MELVTKDDLEGLAASYGVNRYNTILTGALIFKGLMRLILLGKKTSLRMLDTLINEGIDYGAVPDNMKKCYKIENEKEQIK